MIAPIVVSITLVLTVLTIVKKLENIRMFWLSISK